MPDLDTSIKKFQGMLSAAQHRDKVKVLQKNDARTELQTILSRLADCISLIGVGDRSVMATAGFLLNSETRSARQLTKVENFSAVQGQKSDEVVLNLQRQDAGDFYMFYFIEAPAGSTTDLTGWQHQGSKVPTITFKGLSLPHCIHSL